MLAYAADRRPSSALHPKTLALIIAGHAGLLFAVMTARGDIVVKPPFDITEVTLLDPVKPPPPPPPPNDPTPAQPSESHIDLPKPPIPLPLPDPNGPVDVGPTLPTPGSGTNTLPVPDPVPIPVPTPAPSVKVPARSLTSPSDLTPPYPDEKRRLGEEAVIRLSLSIDPRGRVVDVRPLGNADPAFVEAARKHIVRRWRYKPATEDGAAVASTLTVSIRFRMEG